MGSVVALQTGAKNVTALKDKLKSHQQALAADDSDSLDKAISTNKRGWGHRHKKGGVVPPEMEGLALDVKNRANRAAQRLMPRQVLPAIGQASRGPGMYTMQGRVQRPSRMAIDVASTTAPSA